MLVDPATGHYPAPFSLSPLPPHVDIGLIFIASLACLSLVVTVSVLSFISHRFILWQRHGKGYNQCVILVFNLLLADFHQALALSINFYWHHVDGIIAPTGYCWAQGAMLNFGNFASGSFVFAIALHTCYTVLGRRELNRKCFAGIVVVVWVWGLAMSIAGPLRYGGDFYVRAGNWCWISSNYEDERFVLHYLWIFIYQFGTILIYAGLFLYIHYISRQTRASSSLPSSNTKITKKARYMIIYPIVYLIGTLPVAIARMMMFAKKSAPDRYLIFAGAMLTSCGWVDGLVYAFTRKVLVDSENNGSHLIKRWSRSGERKSVSKSAYHGEGSNNNHSLGTGGTINSSFNEHHLDDDNFEASNASAGQYHPGTQDCNDNNLLFVQMLNTEPTTGQPRHDSQYTTDTWNSSWDELEPTKTNFSILKEKINGRFGYDRWSRP